MVLLRNAAAAVLASEAIASEPETTFLAMTETREAVPNPPPVRPSVPIGFGRTERTCRHCEERCFQFRSNRLHAAGASGLLEPRSDGRLRDRRHRTGRRTGW